MNDLILDSREVAQMFDKGHRNLLRDIDGDILRMKKLNGLTFQPVDLFI